MPRTARKPSVVELVDSRVGIRLRTLRRGRLWSPAQAVEAINKQLKEDGSDERMSARVLGSWERGERKPRLGPKIAAAAKVYGVTGEWLLVGEE